MSNEDTVPETATAPQGFTADPGKLYRWDGEKFAEMVFDKGGDRRVPITEEAFTIALAIRAQVQKKVRMRPDISIVVSAIVEQAASQTDIVEKVAEYGLKVYATNKGEKAAAKAAERAARAAAQAT
jgi:GGDEF domain-containing protein